MSAKTFFLLNYYLKYTAPSDQEYLSSMTFTHKISVDIVVDQCPVGLQGTIQKQHLRVMNNVQISSPLLSGESCFLSRKIAKWCAICALANRLLRNIIGSQRNR